MMYGYGFSPFQWIGPVVSVIFWIFIIMLVVRFVRRGKRGNFEGWGEDKDAIHILRERFAKGEIDREEYEERKKVLESK